MVTWVSVFNVWPKTSLLLPLGPEMPKGWTPLLEAEDYSGRQPLRKPRT